MFDVYVFGENICFYSPIHPCPVWMDLVLLSGCWLNSRGKWCPGRTLDWLGTWWEICSTPKRHLTTWHYNAVLVHSSVTSFHSEMLCLVFTVLTCVPSPGCTCAHCGTPHPLWEGGQTGEALRCPDETTLASHRGEGSHGNQPAEPHHLLYFLPHQEEAHLQYSPKAHHH